MRKSTSASSLRRAMTSATIVAALLSVVLSVAPAAGAAPSKGTVTGFVTIDGKPILGATVLIEVMPRLDQAATAPAGAPIAFRVVGQTQSDATGRFAVTIADIQAADIDLFGAANFLATVSDGKNLLRWSFPLTASASPNVATPMAAASSGAKSLARSSIDLRFDLGSKPGAADSANLPSSWADASKVQLTPDGLLSGATQPVTTTSIAAPGRMAPAIACVFAWTNTYKYAVREAYANVWSWTGAQVTMHEAQSTSHQIGAAFRAVNGLWSQSGSVSFGESGSSSIDSPGLYDNQVNNEINYRKQINTCAGGAEWWYPVSTYALNYPVLGWAHSLHPIWASCVTYGAGSTPTKTYGTNVTYAAGVAFGPVSLSAQAGWSTDISMKFNMTTTSKICGSTASGWVSSPEAEAHQ